MKLFRILILTTLILATAPLNALALGGVSNQGVIPSLTVGGRVFTDLSNLIVLYGIAQSASHTTLRKPGGSAGYQVTSGKTLTIYAVECFTVTAAAGAAFQLIYADNDVGVGSATAFTNPVYFAGDPNNAFFYNSATGASLQRAIWYPVPATKYVGMASGSSNDQNCFFYGYEQ